MVYFIVAIVIGYFIFWLLAQRGTFTTYVMGEKINNIPTGRNLYGAQNGLGTWFYKNGNDSNKFDPKQCLFESEDELNQKIQSRKKTII